MSKRSREKTRNRGWQRGLIKLIDDKSGFYLYSNHMVVDHRGRVTSQDNFDPPLPNELLPLNPLQYVPNITRPEPDATTETTWFVDD